MFKNKGILTYTPKHQMHRASVVSRENPERLESGFKYIKNRTDIFKTYDLIEDFQPASDEDIARIHEKSYIDFMEGYCKKGGGFLGDSTYVQKGTCLAARYSAGGAIEVCRKVSSGYKTGFALIRPPGHHALPDNYGGYCIYNNAAIAARWLQSEKPNTYSKIMIVDWDGHAANGTMRTFFEDPTVLTISTHRDPHGFYPHDGYPHQIGSGAGRGYTVNIPLPAGAGDKEFRRVCEEIVFPLEKEFSPDFVIGCSGFDSHYSDTVVGLKLTSGSYHYIAKELAHRYTGRLAVLMEGGYEKFNGKLLHTLLAALMKKDNPYKDVKIDLSGSLMQKSNVRKETEENIVELKSVLCDYPLGKVF